MQDFVFRQESANLDWPLYKQRLQNFFMINRIGSKIIAPALDATPPIAGESTMTALHYLLHVGGPKILEIFNATNTEQTPLNYVSFVTLLDARFTLVNARISDLQFRSCTQNEDESLADFANRLRVLARSAGITSENIDTNILSVIAYSTLDTETRLKCLDENTTLDSLLTWKKTLEIKSACSSSMEQRKSASIFNINTKYQQKRNTPPLASAASSSRKCFLCGFEYPHSKECPAKGKKCNKCGKLNHFESVCNMGKRNTTSSRTPNLPYNNNRNFIY